MLNEDGSRINLSFADTQLRKPGVNLNNNRKLYEF